MQSKRQSVIEISTGISIGIVGSLAITMVTMHAIDNRAVCSVVTVALCTVWSFVRGYGLRRYFNAKVKSDEHG